ncbi:MAG: hypothetical protein ACRENP_22440 [Longimicrobiales bacterium]
MNSITVAVICAASLVTGCQETEKEIATAPEFSMSAESGRTPKTIPISAPKVSNIEVIRDLNVRNEDPRDARERIIKEILAKHPDISPGFVQILRNSDGILISGLPASQADIVDLVSQALQLQEIEFQEHPERFVDTDEEPAKLKERLRARRLEHEARRREKE